MPNQEKILPYALTTVQRVKDLLEITDVDLDPVITRFINAATDFIQNSCNGRRFQQQTYTNEVYSASNTKQKYLVLRQCPVYSVSSFQYRAGPPSAPNWTSFIQDQYELLNPQQDVNGITFYPSGIIRIYGYIPMLYNNMTRVTYVAGFLIDFDNAGDVTKHTLPADISRLCDNLVVRWLKRRDFAGMNAKTLDSSTINFRDKMDQDDLDIMAQYRVVAPTM